MNLRDLMGDEPPHSPYASPEGCSPFLTDPLPPCPLRMPPFQQEGSRAATPARYALWFALAGKDFADGHWMQVPAPSGAYRGVAVFSSCLGAICYLSDTLVPQWSEFIEIVHLSERDLKALPMPILMDGAGEPMAEGQTP